MSDDVSDAVSDAVRAAVRADWDPDMCACRWGEQPCWMCLPVLDARFKARMTETKEPTT